MSQRDAENDAQTRRQLATRFLHAGLVGFALMGPQNAEGQNSGQPTDPIAALVATYDSGWNRQDTVTVSRLLAPRYQYFTSVGGVRSRAEMLSLLGSRGYALAEATRSEVSVTRSGPDVLESPPA
jgi:hypothetical protein